MQLHYLEVEDNFGRGVKKLENAYFTPDLLERITETAGIWDRDVIRNTVKSIPRSRVINGGV